MSRTRMRIDIVSDVVCPWCAVGYHQLAAALAETGTEAEVHWHPFELHPEMPRGGEDYLEYVAAKYGAGTEEVLSTRARIAELGAEVGFVFGFRDGMKTFNSFAAHRLVLFAEAQGRAHETTLALFRAFFTDLREIDREEVLVEIAGETGLDREEARAALGSERIAETVRAREHFWTSRGVRGVPAIVFDREHAVSGAQGVAGFRRLIEGLVETRAS